MKDEVWKGIKGYEDYYLISNYGVVKSIKHNNDLELKQCINSVGYRVVHLYKNGNKKTKTIHQILAVAFMGHKTNGYKMIVDHIDNNKLNNKLSNLQITTQRHNSSKDRKGYSSKYVGVCWSEASKNWMSRIQINGKSVYLGIFENEYDAYLAYQNKLKTVK